MKTARWLAALFRRRKLEAEMAEEMRLHLEQREREAVERGVPPEEAANAALRKFGGVEQVKETCREERGWLWLEQLGQDVRHAFRSLRRNPGFTATVLATLTVAIGANVAIFSVVNGVLLEPLPFPKAERLVSLRETRPLAGGTGQRVTVPVSPATFFDWRNQTRAFEQIAVVVRNEFTLTGADEPEQVAGALVSANLFAMLGVTPRLGRDFLREEDRPNSDPVALLSHGLWQRRFGADGSVVGRTITLEGRSVTIVGVLPAWFDGAAATVVARGTRPEIWLPMPLVEAGAARGVPAFLVHARLGPDASRATAQAEIDAVMQRLAKEFPITNAARGGRVESLMEGVVGTAKPTLWVLFAAVGCVLLIACANIANLLLARAALRQGETAMRAALGASRSRLLRQFLTESALLALAGCALGLLGSSLGIAALRSWLSSSLPRAELVELDGKVLGFAVAVSLLAAVGFGLAPAWHNAKEDLQAMLKWLGRSGGRAGGARLRNGLVILQVAVSLVLLAGAGLLLKSFAALTRVDPGFDAENVLTLRLNLTEEKYRTAEARASFFEQVVARAQQTPGAEAAAAVFPLPFSPAIYNRRFTIPGRPVDPTLELSAECNIVSPEYFRTLRVRVTQGRALTASDRADGPAVAMVNETLAARLWPGESPIGKRIAIDLGPRKEQEIVGVFADIKQRQLESDSLMQVCVPLAQHVFPTTYLAVRGKVQAATLLSAIRREIATLNPNLPQADVALLSDRVASSVTPRRVMMWLLAGFAATALLLAVVGLHGVIAYGLAQRTREFGIRMALGARVHDLLRMVMRQGMRLVLIGLLLGVLGSLALTQVLGGLLFAVRPTDPATFAIVSVMLAAVGALACWLPARRAAKVDPMVALRAE